MTPLETRGAEIEKAVLGYVAAWNEDDPRKLQMLLEQCWADDGVVQSNFEEIRGREALAARISSWRRDVPGCWALFTSGIEHHHSHFRFSGIVVRPNGERFSPALDVGELDRDGRIARIITFHLAMGAPPAHWPRALIAPDAS